MKRSLEERRFDDGRQAARQVIRAAKGRMKGQYGDYVRGWRAALNEVDYLLKINIDHRRIGELVILEK